jgi:hypothetical protein
VNCKDPGPRDIPKIFVDEVRLKNSATTDARQQEKLQTLHAFLSENLKASTGPDVSVRDCGKRFPSDPSDFDRTEFEGLGNMRVVLEVWGSLEDPVKGSGSIGFVLVPARPLAPPAVYVVPSANLLSSLRQGRQMSAFAPLVLGISRYQNQDYPGAVSLLCAGAQQVNSVLNQPAAAANPAFLTQQRALMQKVKEMTDNAIREARKKDSSFEVYPISDGIYVCPK